MATTAQDAPALAMRAIRLDNDVNGNPRYYLPVYSFADESGEFFRPKYCSKYRGKKYGAGYVIQSYSLQSDLRDALKA